MARAPQQRTLQTRARLTDAARELVAKSGYSALRVEEVVLRAGVAKGTFFAHFTDKDALMDLLIGEKLDTVLDQMAKGPAPNTADEVSKRLMPLLNFMTSERYVMEICLRYSGAATIEAIGPIARTFGRQIEILTDWVLHTDTQFRTDLSADLLAEGVQAFALQAMATKFCALHNAVGVEDRLKPYLNAWLNPPK